MNYRAWIAANRRGLLAGGLVLALLAAIVVGLSVTDGWDEPQGNAIAGKEQAERTRDVCASAATYDRLKQVLFEEAIRARGGNSPNLDLLAANSVVRMESPLVESRDAALNVTVCSGTFVLELPPGSEQGFGGERRLTARIEYAAQAAADGSGLVYRMTGSEPIVQRLAQFDVQRGQQTAAVDEGEALAEALPLPLPLPSPLPPPQTPQTPPPVPAREAPPPPRAEGTANPSFNCRQARSRSERMVCASRRLAALDREMSSHFYSALSDADGPSRRALRQTRDRFLAYRDRCPDEACVADAYRGRMAEIRDIMAEGD